jgi:hypothetical protein
MALLDMRSAALEVRAQRLSPLGCLHSIDLCLLWIAKVRAEGVYLDPVQPNFSHRIL